MVTFYSDAVTREGFTGKFADAFKGIAESLDKSGIESRMVVDAFNTLLDVAVVYDINESESNGARLAKIAEAFVTFVAPEIQAVSNRRERATFESYFDDIASFKVLKSSTVTLTAEQKAARKRFNVNATRLKSDKAFSPYTG